MAEAENGRAAEEEGAGQAPVGAAGLLLKLSFLTGSIALLCMVAIDFVSVVCRHLRVPLTGSIELIQACITVAISAAVVGATLTAGHAAVHVLTERMSPAWRRRCLRIADVACVLYFAAAAVGGFWLLGDTLNGDERSDLLRLPITPLRVIWAASLTLAGVLCLLRLVGVRLASGPGEDHA
ncbi:MAG: TRAP transporter small permease [Caulobacteraceae bacterium]